MYKLITGITLHYSKTTPRHYKVTKYSFYAMLVTLFEQVQNKNLKISRTFNVHEVMQYQSAASSQNAL